MLAAKDSKPATSGEWETTTTENEKSSTTSTPQPSGLGELAAAATAPIGRGQGAVQRVQVGSTPGADKSEMSREGVGRRSSPTPTTRPIKYALEICVELEVSPGVYTAPEDDSYGVDFVVETHIGPAKETIFQFVVPQRHRSAAMDGCHREAAHQGQRRSTSLMQERFWWPGMARDLRNRIRKCGRCRKFEAAPPIAPMQPLTCSGPGELLHVDFTSIKETVPLKEEPVIRNVLVLQDHFSKYVVAYVVKDQTARTAAVTLRNGYFGLFGAPAYLVSDQGKAFTGHLITHLCELYGVHKLRTSPYHAQTNGQVERMNQTIIRMIGKLAEDKKARWSEHLPELLSAYNGTRSAVTGYSPYYLLFGRKNRMPVDCLFPTLCESPHRTKMEVSVATMQKRLKEAFEVARRLAYEEATKQRRYYDRRAGAVTLQPGDVVMVRTDGFVGKRKVKDHWEDGGFIVESQLGDWPVYKVRCLSADDRQKTQIPDSPSEPPLACRQ